MLNMKGQYQTVMYVSLPSKAHVHSGRSGRLEADGQNGRKKKKQQQ